MLFSGPLATPKYHENQRTTSESATKQTSKQQKANDMLPIVANIHMQGRGQNILFVWGYSPES